MIIWTGWGIVIGLVGFVCLLMTQLGVDAAMGDNKYYQSQVWPKLVGFWIAAAVSWPIGRTMNQGEEHWRFDPDANEYVITRIPGNHTLFFIPVQYWWPVYLVLGVIVVFVEQLPNR